MKAHLIISTLAILASPFAAAQNAIDDPKPAPVLDTGRKSEDPDREPPAADSTPVATTPAPGMTAPENSEPAAAVENTLKPTEDAPQDAAAVVPAPPAKPEDSLVVRVEKLQTGQGVVDPSKVKLLARFPAKPLSKAPAGWRLEPSDAAPPFIREVEISPGSKITLNIRPHVLIPDADGVTVFSISEPGFDPSLGYQQVATVGAILADSIRQLDENSKQLGNAIDNLQQLLVSLPKPEPKPEAVPVAVAAPVAAPVKPVINRKK